MQIETKNTSLLKNKRAVIFGAGGEVGGSVAREFASQGATVFLSGRTLDPVEQVASEIQKAGGLAHATQIDTLDEQAVLAYLDRVAQEGSIDIHLNVTGPQAKDYGNGNSTLDLPLEQYLLPLTTLVPSQFITARAAARHMVRQHSGVILFVTATPARGTLNSTAIGSAFGAMESLLRGLAADLGTAGVRVVGIRSGPMVETRTIQQSFENTARTLGITKEQVTARFEQGSFLKSSSTLEDTARLATFLSSDWARTLSGTILNASSGRVID